MKKIFLCLISILLILSAEARVWYVSRDGTGDGSSASSASRDLQDVINRASAADEIRIARGLVPPRRPADNLNIENFYSPDAAFVITKPLTLKGGYSYDFLKRDPNLYTTRLGWFPDSRYGIKHHCVIILGVDNVVLDGLTIGGGTANGNGEFYVNDYRVHRNCGGGLYILEASARLENVKILDNIATGAGGGIYNEFNYHNSNIIMSNVEISDNTAPYGGGASFSSSGLEFINVTIKNNSSTYRGGGICVFGGQSLKMKNIKITNNTTNGYGGGIYTESLGSLKMETVEISKNTAVLEGGGLFMYYCYPIAFEIINATICNNSAQKGGGLVLKDSFGSLKNSVMWYNTAANDSEKNVYTYYNHDYLNYYHSLVEGIAPAGNGNLNGITTTSPGFVNVSRGDYRLNENPISPCIGKGNNSYVTTYYDLAGNQRIKGRNVDIGAYESNNSTLAPSPSSDISEPNYENMLLSKNMELNVYPNPAVHGQEINISLGNYSDPVALILYSSDGKEIYKNTYCENNFELKIPELTPGIYVFKVTTEEGEVYTKKVIVN